MVGAEDVEVVVKWKWWSRLSKGGCGNGGADGAGGSGSFPYNIQTTCFSVELN